MTRKAATNKVAKLNKQADEQGIFGKKYSLAQNVITGEYLAATMAEVWRPKYYKLVFD